MRFQFRLRTTLLFVAAVSLALAATRSATSAWASAIITMTVLTLLVSVALAIGSRGERQSFWIGFAVCGAGYFAVVLTPIAPHITEYLATSKAVSLLRDQFHPQPEYRLANPPTPTQSEIIAVNALGEEWNSRARNFRWIGESIWALILGTLGGMLVRLVARRRAGKSGDPSVSGS